MKNVDDGHDVLVPGNSTGSKRTSTTPPDITAVSHLLEQGKLCKDLYLSLGVNHSDIGESSDEDVASILEQMSRFQTSGDPIGRNCERNIADILKEAESLLDEQHHEAQPQSRASGGSFFQCCEFSQMSSLSNNIMDSTSLKDPYQPLSESVKSLDKVLNSTFTKQAELKSSASEVLSSSSENRNCKQSHTIKDCNSRDSAIRLSPPHMVGTPLEVTYQRIHEQIRKEMDGSLMPLLQGDFPDLKMSMPIPGLETPCVDAPSCFSLEQEFLEERKRCLKLRADLDWLKRQYEREVAELRRRHEGQLLQIREEFSSHDDKDTRILSLEKEVETQEKIIAGYQLENEQICAELKEVKRALLKLMALLKTESGDAKPATRLAGQGLS